MTFELVMKKEEVEWMIKSSMKTINSQIKTMLDKVTQMQYLVGDVANHEIVDDFRKIIIDSIKITDKLKLLRDWMIQTT